MLGRPLALPRMLSQVPFTAADPIEIGGHFGRAGIERTPHEPPRRGDDGRLISVQGGFFCALEIGSGGGASSTVVPVPAGWAG